MPIPAGSYPKSSPEHYGYDVVAARPRAAEDLHGRGTLAIDQYDKVRVCARAGLSRLDRRGDPVGRRRKARGTMHRGDGGGSGGPSSLALARREKRVENLRCRARPSAPGSSAARHGDAIDRLNRNTVYDACVRHPTCTLYTLDDAVIIHTARDGRDSREKEQDVDVTFRECDRTNVFCVYVFA